MTREDVVKGLECCVGYENDNFQFSCIYDGDVNPDCPYGGTGGNGVSCMTKLMRDALDLLRGEASEQEPVKPTWIRGRAFCGRCGRQFGYGYKYCPDCGRAVRWG